MHRDIVESAGVWGRLDDLDTDLTAEHQSFNQCRKLAGRIVLLVSLNASTKTLPCTYVSIIIYAQRTVVSCGVRSSAGCRLKLKSVVPRGPTSPAQAEIF
jgi:hypothetical protein